MQEQEIQQFSDQYSRMSELPEDVLGPRTYQPGEAMEGEVVRVDQDGIIVSFKLFLGNEVCVIPLASGDPNGAYLAKEEIEMVGIADVSNHEVRPSDV